jgi:hypothetical protein
VSTYNWVLLMIYGSATTQFHHRFLSQK